MPESGELLPGEPAEVGDPVEPFGRARTEREEDPVDRREDRLDPAVGERRCDPGRDLAVFRPPITRG